jgi:hypothetical protein
MMPVDQIRSCCGDVERACAALLTPEADSLDDCSAVLAGAAQTLTELRPSLHGARGDPEALAEAWRLQRTVRRASALLESAAAYHAGWTELLGVQTAGYGPGGRPGETPRHGGLCLKG